MPSFAISMNHGLYLCNYVFLSANFQVKRTMQTAPIGGGVVLGVMDEVGWNVCVRIFISVSVGAGGMGRGIFPYSFDEIQQLRYLFPSPIPKNCVVISLADFFPS